MKRYHVYRRPAPRKGDPLTTFTNLFAIAFIIVIVYVSWPFLVEQFWARMAGDSAPTAQPTDAHPAIGNQAPPAVRGTTYQTVATPVIANPNVAGNEATAVALYQAAVQGQQAEPIIRPAQQVQLDQSGDMAALDMTQATRTAYLTAVPARAPDVSAQEVATMTGRNPCAVPRADPATCAQGLFKPTPIGGKP